MMREELKRTEDSIARRMGGLETSMGELQDNVRELEGRMDGLDNKMEDKLEELVANRLGDRNRTSRISQDREVDFSEMPSSRDRRYWKARRSLRMWPIRGEGGDMKSAVLTFLATKLRLGEDVIADAENCHIARVPASNNKNNKSKIYSEAVVEFPTVDLRDLVRKSAFNLAGDDQSGIRLEVPHHLMKNFKSLEAASYRLRQKYPNIRRNIKFDDEVCDVVLEFRIQEGDQWKRLRPHQAKELQRSEGGTEEMSASDITSLLDGSDGESGGE